MNITEEQPVQTKFCTICKKIKPLSEFNKDTRNADCKDHKCKPCRNYSPEHKKKPKKGFYDVDADYRFLNEMNPKQGTGHIKEYHQPKGKRK